MYNLFSSPWSYAKTKLRSLHVGSSYFALYQFLDDFQSQCILAVGILCAIAAGTPLPLIFVISRSLIESFPPPEDQVQEATRYILIISAVYFVLTWAYNVCWDIVGGRISRRLQELLVERVIGLDMAYFDTEQLNLTSILTADTQTIQRGTSQKVGLFIQSASYFLATFITGFVIAPALTAVLLAAILPTMIILVTCKSSLVSKCSRKANHWNEAAAHSAEQAIGAVQVVQAFGAIDRLCRKYGQQIRHAASHTYRKSIYAGVMLGLVFFVAYSAQGLAFYWGTRIGGSSGTIYAVVFLILDASFVVNQVGPFIQNLAMASSSGSKVLQLIHRQRPAIDPYATTGEHIISTHLEKGMNVECVSFAYPARPDQKVLKDISLRLPAGSSTGIVGPSGSGKSSLAGLLLRLYDPQAGRIMLGGNDLSIYNVKSLRSHIALVDQEPVLFSGTILDNVRSGIVEIDNLDEDEIRQRCQKAVEDANANDFVSQLNDGIDSRIDSRSSLSGGQRQRICLARALVRNPSIVILDEPTSALDAISEVKILESIQRLCQRGCTVVMIAHRLATVKDLDRIAVVGDGSILEQGTHYELMANDGPYKALVSAQEMESSPSTGPSATSSLTLNNPHTEDIKCGDGSEHAGGTVFPAPASGHIQGPLTGQINPTGLQRGSLVCTPEEKVAMSHVAKASEQSQGRPQLSSGQLLRRIFGQCKPELPLLVLGLFAAGIFGSIIVYEAIVLGNIITVINTEQGMPGFQASINFFCLMYLIISLITLTMAGTANTCFGLASDAFLVRIRDASLRSILAQDQSFFLAQDRSTHHLVATINADTNHLAALSGTILTAMIGACFNIVSGVTIALVYAWTVALVLLSITPATVLAGFFRFSLLSKFETNHNHSFKHAAALASEAVHNIRTVAAFGREHEVLQRYRTAISKPYRQNFWYCVFGDLALTLNYAIVYFTYALAYWYGSKLVREGKFSERDFFTMLPAFLLTAQQSGQLFTGAPELVQARAAAGRVFALIDEKPTILEKPNLAGSNTFLVRERNNDKAPDVPETKKILAPELPVNSPFRGSETSIWRASDRSATSTPVNASPSPSRGAGVQLHKVSLGYLQNPDRLALRDVNLYIEPGQSVGIVGPSGAGKSSLISLLGRFFDPSIGRVLIDDQDIKTQDVGRHRARLALVSQEPSLFAGSIAFNIGLGASPYGPLPTQDEIETVCTRIGMHDFLMSLPDGYATECGSGGSRLSGGQKQRVAIARALIRDPELLILDEATSALDSHSERQVQEALSTASDGRTTIIVAHRLSTIRQADVIFCFDKGRLVEQGNHDDLVRLGGVYAGMAKAQSLS